MGLLVEPEDVIQCGRVRKRRCPQEQLLLLHWNLQEVLHLAAEPHRKLGQAVDGR